MQHVEYEHVMGEGILSDFTSWSQAAILLPSCCNSESYKGSSSVRWEEARLGAWKCSSRWQTSNLLKFWLLPRSCWYCIYPHISNLMATDWIMSHPNIYILTLLFYMVIFWRHDYIRCLEMGRLFWIVWVGLKNYHIIFYKREVERHLTTAEEMSVVWW